MLIVIDRCHDQREWLIDFVKESGRGELTDRTGDERKRGRKRERKRGGGEREGAKEDERGKDACERKRVSEPPKKILEMKN